MKEERNKTEIKITREEIQREGSGSFPLLPGAFLAWYDRNKRSLPWRRDQEPYHVWLSEIMLQQTRVEAARGYYQRFVEALPDVTALARADEELLLKLWEGLGYYNRARNLQKAAKVIADELGGEFPRDYAGLLALPGIGEYTAGAVGSICFDLPTPAIDGNVLRLLARINADETPLERPELKRRLNAELAKVYEALKPVKGRGRRGDFTQALIEAGALLCLPKGAPRCGDCPAAGFCLACRQGLTERLPVKSPKKARRVEERTVFVLERQGRLALRKRPASGLLSRLWELPNAAGKLDPPAAVGLALRLLAGGAPERPGKRPGVAKNSRYQDDPSGDGTVYRLTFSRVLERVHVFSHVEWRMRCYYFQVGGGAGEPGAGLLEEKVGGAAEEGLVWVTQRQLAEEYALPTAFSQFLREK